MELIYKLITPDELSKLEKLLFECKHENFCFFRRNGVLKINKSLPQCETLIQIADQMWQIDQPLDSETEDRMAKLWQQVIEAAGTTAAKQLNLAWLEALREKTEAEDQKAAEEWTQIHNIDNELSDILCTMNNFRYGSIEALWRKTMSVDAIFLYGFCLGRTETRNNISA